MFEINAQKRILTGKKVSSLRKEGLLPAGVYGISGNISIAIDKKEFLNIFKKTHYTQIINLLLDNKPHNVLVSEIQTHPVNEEVLHVSFHEISLSKKVEAEVPIEIEGIAPAIKVYGGVLVQNFHHIEIISLPNKIPNSIKIDISKLEEIGDSITFKDLLLPEGTELTKMEEDEFENAIVTISPPQEEEIEETEEISPEDVEVIKEKEESQEEK
ncbi:50S ribosomal protein L25 [Patescibacteria group bacterium]|nr:50S ribosomal protein L25 [Patescibacteria group bacterium]